MNRFESAATSSATTTSAKSFLDHLLDDFCSPEDFQLLRDVLAIYNEVEEEKVTAN